MKSGERDSIGSKPQVNALLQKIIVYFHIGMPVFTCIHEGFNCIGRIKIVT